MAECAQNGKDTFELVGQERWHVAQTLRHHEKMAERHLKEQGFRGFFPLFRKTVRNARQLREIAAPVFPGYIFVILDLERDRWRSINGTLGIARLLTALQQPIPVPAGVVEGLIATLDHSGLALLGGDLKTGQVVKVVAGPFAGQIGVLERLDAKGRVRVLLNIMGGQAPILVDRARLAA